MGCCSHLTGTPREVAVPGPLWKTASASADEEGVSEIVGLHLQRKEKREDDGA